MARASATAQDGRLALGAPCPNCGTALAGNYCYECGQKAEEYHRSVWKLATEAAGSLFDLDGRFWTTIPRLIYRPGKLTHDYLSGHRAAQVPPFRMYLIAVILALFAWGANQSAKGQHYQLARPTMNTVQLIEQKAKGGVASRVDVDLWQPRAGDNAFRRWVREHGAKAMRQPDAVLAAMARWSERFAILMLPLATGLLCLLFAFRRDIFLFDHVIFAMHSLTFLGLLLTAVLLLGMVTPWAAWLLLAAPVHLFVHMRGTYRTGVFGTLARMALLLAGSAVAVLGLIGGLVLVGLSAAR